MNKIIYKGYEDFMNAIDSQVNLTKDCNGYEAFKNDVKQLKIHNTGEGLAAITANHWLRKICEMSLSDLTEYVNEYQLGWLDAFEAYKS